MLRLLDEERGTMETFEDVARRPGSRGVGSGSGSGRASDRGSRRGVRGSLALIAWLAGLVLALAFFHALGSGSLAAPPARPAAWGAWLDGRDPLVAVVAVLRLVVLGLGWYLLAATLLGTAARLLRAVRLVAITDAVTVPSVRRLLRNAVGVSLATAMIATGPGAAGQVGRAYAAPPATAADVLPVDVTAGPASGDDEQPERGTQALPLPLELAHDTPAADAPPADAPPADAPSLADAPPPADDASSETDRTPADDASPEAPGAVTVAPGDSLWSIAHHAVAGANGAAEPSEKSVATYWRQLVERNRSSLSDPANPDLIFPGETVVLPDLPGGVSAGP